MQKFYDYDPEHPFSVTKEQHTVKDKKVRLNYTPALNSVKVTKGEEALEQAENQLNLKENQFFIDYQAQSLYKKATQVVHVNLPDETELTFSYMGVSTILFADHMNEIKSFMENTSQKQSEQEEKIKKAEENITSVKPSIESLNSQVATLAANSGGVAFEFVDSLPNVGDTNKIYLKVGSSTAFYDVYIFQRGHYLQLQATFKREDMLNPNLYKMKDVYPNTYATMTSIPSDYLSKVDISSRTNFDNWFEGCKQLQTIPNAEPYISALKRATSAQYAFAHCENLTNIPYSSQVNTIKNMNSMFAYCLKLPTYYINFFRTTGATSCVQAYAYLGNNSSSDPSTAVYLDFGGIKSISSDVSDSFLVNINTYASQVILGCTKVRYITILNSHQVHSSRTKSWVQSLLGGTPQIVQVTFS